MKGYTRIGAYVLLTLWTAACGGPEVSDPAGDRVAIVGARLVDGTGRAPIDNAVMVLNEGRVQRVGTSDQVMLPEGVETIDLTGRTIVPGLIVSHGHVGASRGLETGESVYTRDNVLAQLRLYAYYGITTVMSLGGDGPVAASLRDEQNTPGLDRARLFYAGEVLPIDSQEAARAAIDRNSALKVDFIKIRVDDNLGTASKMPAPVYTAAIEYAHSLGLPVAAHVYYLEDAKSLLRAGVDFLAHSIRDQDVDEELLELMRARNVCLCPTLTREFSTFVYESTPEFFTDPFFLQQADPAVLNQLRDPQRQQTIEASRAAQLYKQALGVATRNLRSLVAGGVTIAMGTDTGPPGRFQGYFEHLEVRMMAEAGIDPQQIIRSATGDAARCLRLEGVGSLEPTHWADFVVLREDPSSNIHALEAIESVWIAGQRIR